MEVVLDTEDGNILMDYLKSTVPLPDLLILDITMPVIDGLSLLKKIRGKYSSLPCLIYSAQADRLPIGKAIRLGANGYLSKEYNFDALYRAAADIIEHGFAYTPTADERFFELVRKNKILAPILTQRERQFIKHLASEKSYRQIAKFMNISANTIEGLRVKCFKKLRVTSKVGLVLAGVRLGIINL